MKTRWKATATITAIAQSNATAKSALFYVILIQLTVRTVNKGVMDFKYNQAREMLKIHPVPVVLNIETGTDGWE
jgi:hypothetical protein